jgi:hypothetical protein
MAQRLPISPAELCPLTDRQLRDGEQLTAARAGLISKLVHVAATSAVPTPDPRSSRCFFSEPLACGWLPGRRAAVLRERVGECDDCGYNFLQALGKALAEVA